MNETGLWLAGLLVGAVLLWLYETNRRTNPGYGYGGKRSRRIPAEVRRMVIQRDLGDTPFDPKRHHIDHIVPFSKGGDNTVDNLRVIEKGRNLRKGAKTPDLAEIYGDGPSEPYERVSRGRGKSGTRR